MIPILYSTSETSFTSNGLGRLTDCISCLVTEERNGIFECEFQYPITGKLYNEMVTNGGIISVTHDDAKDRQPFDIYKYSAPIDGIVTFNARHISYRLSGITVKPFTAASCALALQGIGTNSLSTNPFSFWTDKAVTSTFTLSVPTSAKAILAGQQGSILDVYGKGEYKFDKFDVKLYTNRGTNSGVTIRYGKNLSDTLVEKDNGEYYNAIVPYWKGEDGTLVTLTGWYVVQTGETLKYCVPVDFSSEFQSQPTELELRTKAAAYLANNTPWLPKENIKVDFVQLWNTDEYKNVAVLERVKLCDTVAIYYPALGLTNSSAKVIKVVYDTLLERYTSIELGEPQQTLAESIMQPYAQAIASISDKASVSFMEEAIQAATDLITGGLGGHVVINRNANGEPEEILIMDTDDTSTAVNVWRWNLNGLAHSHSGYNGPFDDIAITQDGKINASLITTGVINANLITAGTLSADRISGGTIDASNVTITNLNASNITSGALSADRIAAGSLAISKLDTAAQNTINTAASNASTALSDAAAAQSTANSANSQEQLIYISKPSGTTTQSGTTTWVTDDRGYQNGWTIKRPVYSPNYPVLFVATQRKSVGGTITCTTPQIDNTTTVIDGGHITTGTIDAGVVNVTNINASNITSGTMSANKISGGTLTVGGLNNENGILSILDSGGIRSGEINNNGIILYDAPNRPNNVSLVLSSVILGRDMYQTVRTQLDYMSGIIILKDANGTTRVKTSGDDGYLGLGDGTRERFIVVPSNGQTRWYDENGNLRIYFDSSSANDYAQFLSELRADDVTVNGVLDVTQRRASASLSSAGWYRVLTFDAQTAAQAQGGTGLTIDFNIVRWGSSNVSEQHKITLYSRFNGLSFDSEISRSSTQLIDKIRYNYGTDDGYVDIHYTGTSANEVTVYYETYIDPTYQGRITSSGLAIVAASPSGETAGAASYTFGENVPDSGTGYLKQADGTLIQWGTVSGLSFTAQNLISGTENLPVSFANTSYIVQASAITTGVNQYLFRCGAYPNTTAKFDWVLGSGDSSNITIANRGFVWTAIGRWK